MRRSVTGWALASLAAAGFLAWIPILGLGFISDSFLLPLLLDGKGGVAWGKVLSEWARPWMEIQGGFSWRPFVTLHYALDLSLFGVSAPGLHLSNLLFHLAAGLGVFALLRKILPREGIWAAWVGAFLYLVHPARAEAVAWIAGRVDVTPALPAVLCLLVYLRAGESKGGAKGVWTLLSLFLALLAYAGKEMALALPASLLFLEILKPRKGRGGVRSGFLLHLLLFGAVLAWRAHVLGSVTGAAASGNLAGAFLATLPGKARAAFLPPPPGGIPAWGGLALWVFLPLLSGLVRGGRALLALPLLLWWALLLVPAAPVWVYPDWAGSRVLLFPALPAAALAAVLLGPPPAKRNLWPLGSLRWLAGGGLCALASAGLLFRLQDWRAASNVVDRALRTVEAKASLPGKGPLGLVHLPRRHAHVHPFRYDCAFMAFRPPFLERPRDVLVLENAFLPPLLDAGPLHETDRFCRALLAWEPALGRFTDQKVRTRRDVSIPLEKVKVIGEKSPLGERGFMVEGGKGKWTWLRLPSLPVPYRAVEGIQARVSGAGPGLEMVLAWAPPGEGKELQEGNPLRLGPLFTCPLHPFGPGKKRWIGACGNRVGFYPLGRWGKPVPLALAVKGEVLLTSLTWLGRLPRLAWDPPEETLLDPSHPVLPVPESLRGPAKVVLLTPSKVFTQVFQARGGENLLLDWEGKVLLGFLKRALPGGRGIYFYWERLAGLSDPGTTLERSLPAPALLGSSSTGRGKRGYPSTGGGPPSEKNGKASPGGKKEETRPKKELRRK